MFDTYVLLELADEQIQARLDEAAHQRLVDEALRGQLARGVESTGAARPWWRYSATGRRRARPEGTAV